MEHLTFVTRDVSRQSMKTIRFGSPFHIFSRKSSARWLLLFPFSGCSIGHARCSSAVNFLIIHRFLLSVPSTLLDMACVFNGRSMSLSRAIPVIGGAFDTSARSLADVSRIIGEKVDARCPDYFCGSLKNLGNRRLLGVTSRLYETTVLAASLCVSSPAEISQFSSLPPWKRDDRFCYWREWVQDGQGWSTAK